VCLSALPDNRLKYHPLSPSEKTQRLTPRDTESGYEASETKILAAAVAAQIDVTHLYEDVGDKEIWRRGDYIAPFSATLLFSVTSFVKPVFSVV
jgi:hypothetical protein